MQELFIVWDRERGWLTPGHDSTDDILKAGVWPKVLACSYAVEKAKRVALPLASAWDEWLSHHGPKTSQGTVYGWLTDPDWRDQVPS